MIRYRGAKIQLLDLPGIIEGAKDGKGRGRQVGCHAASAIAGSRHRMRGARRAGRAAARLPCRFHPQVGGDCAAVSVPPAAAVGLVCPMQVISTARTCNLIIIVLDCLKPITHKKLIEHELEGGCG